MEDASKKWKKPERGKTTNYLLYPFYVIPKVIFEKFYNNIHSVEKVNEIIVNGKKIDEL